MNQTIQNMMDRRSVRAFTTEQAPDELINEVLLAGRSAATAMNAQAWHFSVVQNKELMTKINEECRQGMLNSGNPALAERANSPNFSCFYSAPTVIFVSGKADARFSEVDGAGAMQNMCVAAHSLGLGSCYTAMKTNAFDAEIGAPQGYKVFFGLALGYTAGAAPVGPGRREDVVNWVR